MQTPPNFPIAYLSGVIENPGEHAACSLVFQLETAAGNVFPIHYRLLMETLRFAEKEGVIPPLSPHWWARIGSTDGCTIQG